MGVRDGRHKPHNPLEFGHPPPPHLPPGPAANAAAAPLCDADDGSGSYGGPPPAFGMDDRHKAHPPS